MAGVGFPVAVQRSSARWPCWMFSTEGLMVATGWAPSAAAEGDTSVKNNSKWRARFTRGRWRNKAWRDGEVGIWIPVSGVYNHSPGITGSCGSVFNCSELIRPRGRGREGENDGLCPCPHPHPWQSGSSEHMKQMRCGRQTLAWPLGILLSVPVWLAARSILYDSRVTEQQKGLFRGEGGAQGYLSKAGKNPWDCCCFQSDLGDIKGRENLHWTVSVQAFCRVYVKRSLIESMHQ